ncbi:uncharacterized protein [Solanum lycopersicum]|uniref:uncharacterized protein n=1 Tax=Solanum lycopersicum TaxID=4081 RepID=UPI00374A6F01
MPKPSDQAAPSNGGGRNNFGVREQPRFKKGHQSSGNSNSRKRASPKGGRLEPKKSGHMVKDCPQNRGQARGKAQPRPNPQIVAAAEPPKRNRFYALKGREEQEKSADVVTGMLQVFSASVYALLDPRYMLSFVTPLVSLTFEIFPEVLHDPIEPVVNEFQDVFPDYFPRVPPLRKIDFGIYLEPDTKPISIPPYKMASVELNELKV